MGSAICSAYIFWIQSLLCQYQLFDSIFDIKYINRIEDIPWSIYCPSSAVHILLKLTSDKEALNDFFPIFAVDTISVINYVYILDISSDGMKDNYRKSENEKDVGLPSVILYCMLI